MAIIQTGLTEATIQPEELARIPEIEWGGGGWQRTVRQGDWIGFNGKESFFGGNADFGRTCGMNIQTGRLHIGNIQMEAPLAVRIEQKRSMDWPRRDTDGAPIIMELERLAREGIGRMELIDVENDCMPGQKSKGDVSEFNAWESAYRAAAEKSKTGKPRIEDFCRTRSRDETLYMSPRELRVLFGDRIYEMMRKALAAVR